MNLSAPDCKGIRHSKRAGPHHAIIAVAHSQQTPPPPPGTAAQHYKTLQQDQLPDAGPWHHCKVPNHCITMAVHINAPAETAVLA